MSQWISRQSQTVANRQELLDAVASAETKFQGKEVPCPEHWGGYSLKPVGFEFWRGEEFRLHDRFQFRREEPSQGWTAQRLSP